MSYSKKFRSVFIALFVIAMASFFITAFPAPVKAADGVSSGLNDLKNQTNGAYANTVLDSKKSLAEVFGLILQYALGIAFVIAVIMVIYGGYQYITSAGNEEKATKGRQTIIYALIGMVIVVFSFAIVSVVLNFTKNGVGTVPAGTGSGTTNPNGTSTPTTPTTPTTPSGNGNNSPV